LQDLKFVHVCLFKRTATIRNVGCNHRGFSIRLGAHSLFLLAGAYFLTCPKLFMESFLIKEHHTSEAKFETMTRPSFPCLLAIIHFVFYAPEAHIMYLTVSS
jgi:hypothetical protein